MSRILRAGTAFVVVPMRLYLGAIFIYASLHKIAAPYDFALSVATYQILPAPAVNLFALLVPWIELALGIALILGIWTRMASTLASALLRVFIAAIAIALGRGLQLSCGCFASQQAAGEMGIPTLLRDVGWLALGLCVVALDDGKYGLDRFLDRPAIERRTT